MSSSPPPLASDQDKAIGEFVVAGCSGFNPFPDEPTRLAWVKDKLARLGVRAGTFTICSDMGSGDLVLLPRLDIRMQERNGGNFVPMGHVYVVSKASAALLDKLGAQGDPWA